MIGILTKKGIEVNIIDLINKYKKEGYNKIKSKFTVKYKSPILKRKIILLIIK